MKAEYLNSQGYLQRDSVERKEYVGAQSTGLGEGTERGGASDLLEVILDRNNLNRAYKRVKRNHGAAGIDGMTVDEALPWLREHRDELLQSIRDEQYKPSPVRRKEIPKPDGSGVRKLGIPTVIDRVIQQAIAQKLQNIWEPLFSDSSFGYRPKRSAQQAIQRVKAYAEEGYTHAVSIDLSKYFDTLNHELLMDLLHKHIQDIRVMRLIKKYLKSGVMENGVICKTEEGSPQGGPLSPLLANIYLHEFDKEMESRGVKMVRYADDIVVFAKSQRAANRLLESCRRYLEGRLKLKTNTDKSKVTSIYAKKKFKFLGFCIGKGGNGVFIRVHKQSLQKARKKLIQLTKRNRGCNVRRVMEEVKIFVRGWVGYFRVADMKRIMGRWDEWIRRRIRMYIWKQWKKPRTRVQNLIKLGIPEWAAKTYGNARKGYWRMSGTTTVMRAISNERLAAAGYFEILTYYESVHLCD